MAEVCSVSVSQELPLMGGWGGGHKRLKNRDDGGEL